MIAFLDAFNYAPRNELIYTVFSLQAIGDNNLGVVVLHPPFLDNWFEEIVRPLQIQDTQKAVDRYKNERPMQTRPRPDNDIISHTEKNQEDSRIDYASD